MAFGSRGVARLGLPQQQAELGAEPQILLDAEMVVAQPAPGVDQQRARRALQAVGAHGEGNGAAVGVGEVDAHRKGIAMLGEKDREGLGAHHRVMLEDGVQADDGERGAGQQPRHPLGLGQAVEHAAGAEHLEGVDQHHLAAQALQAQRRVAVEPAADPQGGGRW